MRILLCQERESMSQYFMTELSDSVGEDISIYHKHLNVRKLLNDFF